MIRKNSLNFAGVCSKVDEEDCHQIDHCQLVSGPNNECTCQDPCQNSNNQDTMVRFHNFCPVKYYIQVSDKVEKILKGTLRCLINEWAQSAVAMFSS